MLRVSEGELLPGQLGPELPSDWDANESGGGFWSGFGKSFGTIFTGLARLAGAIWGKNNRGSTVPSPTGSIPAPQVVTIQQPQQGMNPATILMIAGGAVLVLTVVGGTIFAVTRK